MKKRRKGGRKNFIDMTNTSSYDKNYDSLDESCTDPKTIDDYLEFIKIGSQIKENLVRRTTEENTIFTTPSTSSVMQTPKADEPKPGSRPTDLWVYGF
jgi:hypothetical protein